MGTVKLPLLKVQVEHNNAVFTSCETCLFGWLLVFPLRLQVVKSSQGNLKTLRNLLAVFFVRLYCCMTSHLSWPSVVFFFLSHIFIPY